MHAFNSSSPEEAVVREFVIALVDRASEQCAIQLSMFLFIAFAIVACTSGGPSSGVRSDRLEKEDTKCRV